MQQRITMRATFTYQDSRQQQDKNDGTPKIPRGLRSLPVTSPSSSPREELALLKKDVSEIERWWADSTRWGHTKRVYSGEIQFFYFFFHFMLLCVFMLWTEIK